jgi:hypothetical protein
MVTASMKPRQERTSPGRCGSEVAGARIIESRGAQYYTVVDGDGGRDEVPAHALR